MIGLFKSLCFWRYRRLYLAAIQEKAQLAFQAMMDRRAAKDALDELQRMRGILAPYGERILTGQAEGTTGVIRLPELEFEMAKAFFHSGARAGIDFHGGFIAYNWRGRNVRCVEPEEHAA